MEKNMELENIYGRVAKHMLVIGELIKETELVGKQIQMVMFIEDNGKMVRETEMEKNQIKMAIFMKESFSAIKSMEPVNTHGRTVVSTKESGEMEN